MQLETSHVNNAQFLCCYHMSFKIWSREKLAVIRNVCSTWLSNRTILYRSSAHNAAGQCLHTAQHLELELLNSFPGEVSILTAEMAISSSLLEDWAGELEIAHDHSWSEIEVRLDDGQELAVWL